MRFVVQEGSNSGHCCFDYTVVDTARIRKHPEGYDMPPIDGQSHYETVCECFRQGEAEVICAALNAFPAERIDVWTDEIHQSGIQLVVHPGVTLV
jgi:hypothetical protein